MPATTTVGRAALAAAAIAAPDEPGVYLFLGENLDVLYVGKAGHLRRRLQQHARSGSPTSHLHGRYDLVRHVRWEVTPDEESAAWREADLIFALRPPFNAESGARSPQIPGREQRAPYLVVRPGDRSDVSRGSPWPRSSRRAECGRTAASPTWARV